jgi:hypothetical protein
MRRRRSNLAPPTHRSQPSASDTLEEMRRNRYTHSVPQPRQDQPVLIPSPAAPATPTPLAAGHAAATPSPAQPQVGWQPTFTPGGEPEGSASRLARRRRAVESLGGVIAKMHILRIVDAIECADSSVSVLNEAYEEAGPTLSVNSYACPHSPKNSMKIASKIMCLISKTHWV